MAAASELFDEQGVEATKVEAICDEADIALRTFYNHFPTKRDVVEQLAVDATAEVATRIRSAHSDGGSTRERLSLFFDRSAVMDTQGGPMHRELLGALVVVNVGAQNLQAARDAMITLLQEGIDRGEVTAGHSAGILADVVLGTFYRIIIDSTSTEGYPIREQLDGASRFLRNAIAPAGDITSM